MKQYARIFTYILPYKGKVFLYFLFTVLSIIFSIVSIGMLMPFMELIFTNPNEACADCSTINQVSSNPAIQFVKNLLLQSLNDGGKIKTLSIICGMILIFIILKNLFLYLSLVILNPLKNSLVNHLREELYEKILVLPIGYLNEKRKGDLMSRMTNDVNEVENSVIGTLEGWIRDPLTIIITLTALLYISVHLTIFILVLIPIIGIVIGRISKSLKRHSQDVAEKYGQTLSILEETLGGMRIIKAFNIENLLRGKFFDRNRELLHSKNMISYRRDLASPLSEVMGILIFIVILYYGGSLVLGTKIDMDGPAFLGFLGIFYNLINPSKTLSTSFSNMRKGAAAINRIEEILKSPITVEDNPNGIKLAEFTSSIEFRNVKFAYSDAVILDNINLKVEKGKTVALVGASGAGKSTLADLIPRFHDVTSGEVLIDGENIKNYSLHSIREKMSIVTQEPILFNDTIGNNIRLGKEQVSDEEMLQAAKTANAYDYIIQKEEGFDTSVGDRGMKLSGGERQRLTIARALVKNPPILILDEATSSLDTESERLVQDAINNMMKNRTSIIIAHRLSTIRHADEIIVLQKGKIVERGSHNDLMNINGYYKKLVDMQELK